MTTSALAFEFELQSDVESLGPGSPVTGKLHVRVSRDVVPESLALRLVTVTGSPQASSTHSHAATSLPVGSWRTGETRTFDFSFAIPAQPAYSHEGEVVSVAWHLEAEAQVLWDVNTVWRHALRVVPHEGWGLDVQVAPTSLPKLRIEELLAGALTTFVGLVAVFFLAPPAVVGGSLCLMPLLGFAAPVVLNRALFQRAGRPRVTVKVESSIEGYRVSETRDHLACALVVPSRVGVRRARATLVVREGDVFATSDFPRGERYRAEVSLERVGDQWQGRMPLPPRGSPFFTFRGGEFGLFWELTCNLEVPQGPDLVFVEELFARPV
ncbi:MAG: hypothetical protein IPG17_19545 [Sandaracinaceae bacterium]|nr:hypothetical protein [Sandaracinaceae bacterium]